jgi:hypothetical protein
MRLASTRPDIRVTAFEQVWPLAQHKLGPSWKIRQQTGHASEAMLSRYIRDGELFVNNAAGSLL